MTSNEKFNGQLPNNNVWKFLSNIPLCTLALMHIFGPHLHILVGIIIVH